MENQFKSKQCHYNNCLKDNYSFLRFVHSDNVNQALPYFQVHFQHVLILYV